MVEASLRVVFAVLLGAVLSFLGFGVQPPAADWGLMISNGRAFVDTAPWISLAPGLAMSITVIGISLLGDGLREVLDPRIGGRLMNVPPPPGPLLDVTDLTVRYAGSAGPVVAVRDVSFRLAAGAALGIVGESGSGKSSIAGAILDLLGTGAAIDGQHRLRGDATSPRSRHRSAAR